jgi:para-nitrobenzyl esterase
MTKGNPEAQQISAKGSAAWANLARSGNPSNPSLGVWPQYTLEKRATMVFAGTSHVENAPMDEDRLLWEKITAA